MRIAKKKKKLISTTKKDENLIIEKKKLHFCMYNHQRIKFGQKRPPSS